MYYEVYVDTLFLVNFVMNLYLLMLTNISARCTATRLRMTLAAGVGAFVYVIGLVAAFLPPVLELILQAGISSVLMIKIAFRPGSLSGYKKLLENLLGYSFLFGGALFIMMRYIEGMVDYSLGIAFVMGAGGILYMFGSYLTEKRHRGQEFCTVTLCCGQQKVTVNAILDTGNGLMEPISSKPVSVTNEEVMAKLWPEGMPELYRAIPYHSVGKSAGIMRGYRVERMVVEQEGIVGCYENVYVAVGEQTVSGKGKYEMILNPMLFQREGRDKGERRKL